MNRDYSEQALEKLKGTISEIEDTGFGKFTDFFGDMWNYCLSALGFLSIENYLNDVDTYHKKVLDMHDTSVNELIKIFSDVNDVDNQFGHKMEELTTQANEYAQVLLMLAGTIDPSTGNIAAFSEADASAAIDRINTASSFINVIFDESLTMKEKYVAKEAALELVKDVLKGVGYVARFAGNVATGNVVGAVANAYKIIDTVFSTGQDVASLATIGLGLGLTAVTGNNSFRYNAAASADEVRQRDGLAGELEAAGLDGLAKGAKVVGMAADTVNLFNSAKGVVNAAGEIEKVATSDIFTDATKGAIIKDIVVGEYFGHTDYGDTALGNLKSLGTVTRNTGTIIDLISADSTEDRAKTIFSSTEFGGIASKWDSILDEGAELLGA